MHGINECVLAMQPEETHEVYRDGVCYVLCLHVEGLSVTCTVSCLRS